MNIGALVFGFFCIAACICGGLYIVSVSAATPTYTDSYGQAPSAVTNTSQGIVTSEATTLTGSPLIALILVIAAIVVCAVVVLMYVVSKNFV